MRAELVRAVEISNRIQAIARNAFEMLLQATNAIIVTRSRGVVVPGFEAVAEHMGMVSRQLAADVVPLRRATGAWIRVVSMLIRDEREILMLEAARDAAPHASIRCESIVRSLRARLAEREDVERERRVFVRAVDDVRQTAATACVLARTAKIEATYGAELVEVLCETAASFTLLADTIDESVRTIARWIGTSRMAA